MIKQVPKIVIFISNIASPHSFTQFDSKSLIVFSMLILSIVFISHL